jgi:hypothetical protein
MIHGVAEVDHDRGPALGERCRLVLPEVIAEPVQQCCLADTAVAVHNEHILGRTAEVGIGLSRVSLG